MVHRLLTLAVLVGVVGPSLTARFVVGHKEVHAFFYLWYGNPETDGKYLHWDHEILQHWTPSIAAQYPKGRFQPPGDIGATYMPLRGFYSSNDPATLESQCQELAAAGVDVISASYWPSNRPDGQGVDTEKCIPNLLNAAQKHGLKVNFHLEPYTDRNPLTVREDLIHLIQTHGSHPAFYRHPTRGLPLVYIYDTYLNPASEWAQLFSPQGAHTIRGTEYDHLIIGLVLEARDRTFMRDAYVDGFYTYFSAQRFSYGSTLSSWPTLATWANEDKKLFIPSVGAGYDDIRIRPWNGVNKRARENGAYYRRMFQAAIDQQPEIITLTSYNEWGEGTQLESAQPFTTDKGEQLQDYGVGGPTFYMDLTRELIQQFKGSTASSSDSTSTGSASDPHDHDDSL